MNPTVAHLAVELDIECTRTDVKFYQPAQMHEQHQCRPYESQRSATTPVACACTNSRNT